MALVAEVDPLTLVLVAISIYLTPHQGCRSAAFFVPENQRINSITQLEQPCLEK
jgi:hypothetical protein